MCKINNRKNMIDLIILLITAIVLFISSSIFDLFEKFQDFSSKHEYLDIDEFIVVLALLFFALLIILFRRWKAAIKEVELRLKVETDLKQIDERMKLLTKILRHDISNDLVVIKSAVNIYHRTENPNMINEIEKRVNKSLESISHYKRYEAFISQNSDMIEIDICEVINELKEKYLEVEIEIIGSCSVFADDGLHSIFDNLISNAIKHGYARKINIIINQDRDDCIIEFNDNGIGIPEEARDHIFEQGFVCGENGHTGIGLFIVKQIVKSYAGSIQLNREYKDGTSFIITLKRCLPFQKR